MEVQNLCEPANRLERVRLKYRLTYADLGSRLADPEGGFKKVSAQTARKWCQPAGHPERRTPRIQAQLRIRDVFGLTADDLVADLAEAEGAS